MQRLFLLVALLVFVNSCGSECIEPGEGISSSNIKIEVPVVINGASKLDKSTLWVNSGVDVKSDETIPLTVRDTIDLCADTTERVHNCSNPQLCRKVIVPAVFCSGSTQLKYSSESIDPAVVCSHSGSGFSKVGFYANSEIKVNPGDRVKFNLVPSKTIKITDCYNIPPEVVNYSFVDLEKILLKITKQPSLTSDNRQYIQNIIDNKLPTICEQGLDFVKAPGTEKYIRLEKFKGNTYDVYVNNSFTPYGNKVLTQYNSFYRNSYWHEGGLVDVRSLLKRNEYDYTCNQPTDPDLKKFNTYDVNYRCNNICKENVWGGSCVASLRYKWVPGSNACKSGLGDSSGLTKCKQLSFPVEKWANLLIAKVGGDNLGGAYDFDDVGQQCLPSNKINSACMGFNVNYSSLKLDDPYLMLDNVGQDSKVWLGIAGYANSYADNTGGYHIEVRRSCIRAQGQDLYMYIGSNPGSVAPGDAGTDHIYIKPEDKDGDGIMESTIFVINGDSTKAPKSGIVYFGIKGAIDSTTVEDNFVENPNNNKYTVHIHRVVWNPIFSNLFKSIRGAILKVLYGGSSSIDINNPDGLILKAYNNIINNGLIQFAQAVLVLFIAFSGISFMLGFMQKTQTELVIRVVKIGVVLAAISPSSWELFGVTLFNLFVVGVDELAGIFSGVIGSDTGFAFLDPTVGALLTKETWLRFLSIMFSGPIGFISFILLMWGVWTFLGAIITAVIVYLMSIVAMSLLLMLAPLFIIAILFKVTKTLFDGWIKMMLSISLAPIILFSSLAFLHQVMMAAFYAVNNFSACRGCIFNMKFDIGLIPIEICPIKVLVPTTYVSDYSFKDRMDQLYASGGENVFGLPFNLVAIIVFILSAFAMKAFVRIADSMAKDIAGTMTPNIATPGGAADQATQGLLSLVGQDNQTKQLRQQALSRANVDPTRARIEKRAGVEAGEDQKTRDVSFGRSASDGGGSSGASMDVPPLPIASSDSATGSAESPGSEGGESISRAEQPQSVSTASPDINEIPMATRGEVEGNINADFEAGEEAISTVARDDPVNVAMEDHADNARDGNGGDNSIEENSNTTTDDLTGSDVAEEEVIREVTTEGSYVVGESDTNNPNSIDDVTREGHDVEGGESNIDKQRASLIEDDGKTTGAEMWRDDLKGQGKDGLSKHVGNKIEEQIQGLQSEAGNADSAKKDDE